MELLSRVVTSTRFTPHEFNESVLPSTIAETSEFQHNSVATALDVAHALAFRAGLGASLFASPAGPHFSSEDVKSYASSVFTKAGISVFGTGIDSALLEKLVSKNLSNLPSGAKLESSPSKYYGGDSRVLLESHGSQTVFVGFGSTGPVTPELSVIAAHLNASKAIPWSEGMSPFQNLPEKSTVQTVLLPYSDATLIGWLIQAPTAEGVKAAGQAVVKGVKSEIKEEDLKKSVKKAKFAAASALDTRQGLSEAIALQGLMGKEATVESLFKDIESVSAQAASSVSRLILLTYFLKQFL